MTLEPEEASEAQDQDTAYDVDDTTPEEEYEFVQRMRETLESGRPNEDFIPGQEELSLSSETCPSTLKLEETVHWQDAFLLSKHHKWMWNELGWISGVIQPVMYYKRPSLELMD